MTLRPRPGLSPTLLCLLVQQLCVIDWFYSLIWIIGVQFRTSILNLSPKITGEIGSSQAPLKLALGGPPCQNVYQNTVTWFWQPGRLPPSADIRDLSPFTIIFSSWRLQKNFGHLWLLRSCEYFGPKHIFSDELILRKKKQQKKQFCVEFVLISAQEVVKQLMQDLSRQELNPFDPIYL